MKKTASVGAHKAILKSYNIPVEPNQVKILEVSITMKNPMCTLCNKTLTNMEQLNLHMKNLHQESDSDRLERLTDTFKSTLIQESKKTNCGQDLNSYSCTECGLLFVTVWELNSHNKKRHEGGPITETISVSKLEKKKIEIVSGNKSEGKSEIM